MNTNKALAGHKVDAIRNCDKASFCVIDKDDVQPEKYTTFFRSVIAFGRIHIIEDEQEKQETARLLGNRYNPNQEEAKWTIQYLNGILAIISLIQKKERRKALLG